MTNPAGMVTPKIPDVRAPVFHAAILQAVDRLRVALIEEARAEREHAKHRRAGRPTDVERWKRIATRANAEVDAAREGLDDLLVEDV